MLTETIFAIMSEATEACLVLKRCVILEQGWKHAGGPAVCAVPEFAGLYSQQIKWSEPGIFFFV